METFLTFLGRRNSLSARPASTSTMKVTPSAHSTCLRACDRAHPVHTCTSRPARGPLPTHTLRTPCVWRRAFATESGPVLSFGLPGTDVAYQASNQYTAPTGTDVAYQASGQYTATSRVPSSVSTSTTTAVVLKYIALLPTGLCTCYALSGTDVGYAATRLAPQSEIDQLVMETKTTGGWKNVALRFPGTVAESSSAETVAFMSGTDLVYCLGLSYALSITILVYGASDVWY
eukprot:658622-Rhodomonas_salina.1